MQVHTSENSLCCVTTVLVWCSVKVFQWNKTTKNSIINTAIVTQLSWSLQNIINSKGQASSEGRSAPSEEKQKDLPTVYN